MNETGLHIDFLDIIIYVLTMLLVLFIAFNKKKDVHDENNEFYFFWRDFFPKFWDNWVPPLILGFLGLLFKDEIGYPILTWIIPAIKNTLPVDMVLDRTLTFASVYYFGIFLKVIKK